MFIVCMGTGADKVYAWDVSPPPCLTAATDDFEICLHRANTMFVPIMASRLMLSLKKASVEQRGMWTLETMSALGENVLRDAHTIRFASVKLAVSSQTLETLGGSIPEEVDIELKPMPVPSQNSGS